MKKLQIALVLVLGLFVFSGPVLATDDEESEAKESEPVIMKEVVVTATRYEEEISTVPANVTVITEENIVNSTAQDIPGVLRNQVGIHVVDIQGNRRTYRVDLRGFGETAQSNTLVLVDGRRINQPDLSGADWSLIPLDRVKRIEVIRGGRGSVLYGDNASGGVINIITKEGERFEAGGELAGGSYDTFSANAYVSGTQKDLSYSLSGNYYDSDGYRDNSETESKDFGLNLDYLFGETMKVSLSSGYHEDDTGNPGALKQSNLEAGIPRTGTINPDDFADIEDYYIKLKPEVFFLENSLFQFDLSYREKKSLFFSSFFAGVSFEADTDIETVIASPQLIFKEQLFGLDNNLILGFDFTNAEEDIVNTITGFPTSEFKLERENYGFYIHDEFYFTDNLSVSGGYRYDKANYKFKNSSTTDKADLDENPYTAGVNYNFYKSSYLYFSFSHSFRYPVFEEFFNYTTNTFNTVLIPQTSDDYEIGVRHEFSESFYATANIFRIDTDDEIFLNPITFANENLDGKTRRDGIEILLGKNFKNISLTGSYTYTNAEVKTGQFAGNQVPAVPEHKATAEVVFSPVDGFTIAINGYYIGKRFFESDFANAFRKQDDYVVLNTKFKYTWEKYTAFLDINNFLDEEYSEFGVLGGFPVEPAFYPSPEINFLVGVSAVF